MKKSLFALLAAVCLTMVACGGAHAATYPNEFTDVTSGYVYTLDTAQKIVITGGYIQVTDSSYVGHQHYDPTGAQFTRLKTAPAFADFYEVIPGTWVNMKFAKELHCIGNTVTVTFPMGYDTYSDSGCTRFNALKAATN
jgi:hypothetical protein